MLFHVLKEPQAQTCNAVFLGKLGKLCELKLGPKCDQTTNPLSGTQNVKNRPTTGHYFFTAKVDTLG